MKPIIFFLLCLLLISFSSENNGAVIVSISNIKESGSLHIGLYRKGDDFPEDGSRMKSALLQCTGNCLVTFENVPYGEYAIAIFQDVNNNDKLDTGLFGIPSEPFAFSNNFRPKFSGPSFEKCKFALSADQMEVKITLINSLFGGD